MAKQVILAVAGSGKTYTICNKINPHKKNLILAFTHENIHNIKYELIRRFGKIPKLTNIMTYDAFLYRYILCPFEPTILECFKKTDFVRKGITILNSPKSTRIIKGKRVFNPMYAKKDQFEHYNLNGWYFCDTLAELILYVKVDKERLTSKIVNYLNLFYDQVCIDEFQDFRIYDFDLIITLTQGLNNVLLVGDYYQHSVSGDNNSGKPFNKMDLNNFIKYLENKNIIVDTFSLKKSRRCPVAICEFVNKKLAIDFDCDNENKGDIFWLDEESAHNILKNDNIIKLVWSNAKKYSFNALNWSYSKGDTYDSVCIILTDKTDNIQNNDFDVTNLSEIVRNKLYVAITRTRGDLYFIKKETFNKIKELYVIQ